tara:strand:+ start:11230 stop:11652 length:423 start_codon:yes stop_codon:yes gene_type:complete
MPNINISISQLPNAMDKLSLNIIKAFDKSVKNYVVENVASITDLSPIDTTLYRSNHHVSINQKSNDESHVKGPGEVINLATNKVKSYKSTRDNRIFIQNNLDYSENLENGGSKQAPIGVYKIALAHTKFDFKKEDLENGN